MCNYFIHIIEKMDVFLVVAPYGLVHGNEHFGRDCFHSVGCDSIVDIATYHGLDGLGIKCQWGREFLQLSARVQWPTQLPVQWVLSHLSGGKADRAWH